MKRLWAGVVSVFLVGLAGCGDPSERLYVYKIPETKPIEQTHALKELHGKNKVDILWVIDNSGSMSENQEQVRVNSNEFISKFITKTGLQWKMGLISTDVSNPPFVGFRPGDALDYQSSNPVQLFQGAVKRLGIYGDAVERFYEPVLRAFDSHPHFLRQDAVLALIVVTDEEEQSTISLENFLQKIKGYKNDLKDVYTYGLFAASDDGCDTQTMFTYQSSRYKQFIDKTKGKKYSLCDPNIGAKLAEMGDDLVQQLVRPRLYLSARPVVNTITVTYKGELLKWGQKDDGGLWLYDYGNNAILFHDLDFAPGPEEKVTVNFETELGVRVRHTLD